MADGGGHDEARVSRWLQQAALEIESHPALDFADLAVRLGWYDQAHFIDDFRSMLGSTPGEYASAYGG